jgi:hypothetical protein
VRHRQRGFWWQQPGGTARRQHLEGHMRDLRSTIMRPGTVTNTKEASRAFRTVPICGGYRGGCSKVSSRLPQYSRSSWRPIGFMAPVYPMSYVDILYMYMSTSPAPCQKTGLLKYAGLNSKLARARLVEAERTHDTQAQTPKILIRCKLLRECVRAITMTSCGRPISRRRRPSEGRRAS